jgi:hypothetical protein
MRSLHDIHVKGRVTNARIEEPTLSWLRRRLLLLVLVLVEVGPVVVLLVVVVVLLLLQAVVALPRDLSAVVHEVSTTLSSDGHLKITRHRPGRLPVLVHPSQVLVPHEVLGEVWNFARRLALALAHTLHLLGVGRINLVFDKASIQQTDLAGSRSEHQVPMRARLCRSDMSLPHLGGILLSLRIIASSTVPLPGGLLDQVPAHIPSSKGISV